MELVGDQSTMDSRLRAPLVFSLPGFRFAWAMWVARALSLMLACHSLFLHRGHLVYLDAIVMAMHIVFDTASQDWAEKGDAWPALALDTLYDETSQEWAERGALCGWMGRRGEEAWLVKDSALWGGPAPGAGPLLPLPCQHHRYHKSTGVAGRPAGAHAEI